MPEAPAVDPVRRRAAVVATAVALPLAVLLALLFNRGALRSDGPAATATAGPTRSAGAALPPIPVAPPPGSPAGARSCPALVAALPARLGDLAGRPVRAPSAAVLAWGEPPVVLRCGVPRPAGFVAGAPDVLVVNGVTWFAQPGQERTVWTVVDRAVYVEATVPTGYASAPIPPLSDAVTATLPVLPLRPGR
jgi:hypothetical protein